jgi:hypothetical protein
VDPAKRVNKALLVVTVVFRQLITGLTAQTFNVRVQELKSPAGSRELMLGTSLNVVSAIVSKA